jgi:hypothetical protein
MSVEAAFLDRMFKALIERHESVEDCARAGRDAADAYRTGTAAPRKLRTSFFCPKAAEKTVALWLLAGAVLISRDRRSFHGDDAQDYADYRFQPRHNPPPFMVRAPGWSRSWCKIQPGDQLTITTDVGTIHFAM